DHEDRERQRPRGSHGRALRPNVRGRGQGRMRIVVLALLFACRSDHSAPPRSQPAPTQAPAPPLDPWIAPRNTMADETSLARGVTDPRGSAAMRKVQRHRLVPPDKRGRSYEDNPLPIGFEQTISQPYIVAAMTEAARLAPGQKVLEIGTGSGYQAAV